MSSGKRGFTDGVDDTKPGPGKKARTGGGSGVCEILYYTPNPRASPDHTFVTRHFEQYDKVFTENLMYVLMINDMRRLACVAPKAATMIKAMFALWKKEGENADQQLAKYSGKRTFISDQYRAAAEAIRVAGPVPPIGNDLNAAARETYWSFWAKKMKRGHIEMKKYEAAVLANIHARNADPLVPTLKPGEHMSCFTRVTEEICPNFDNSILVVGEKFLDIGKAKVRYVEVMPCSSKPRMHEAMIATRLATDASAALKVDKLVTRKNWLDICHRVERRGLPWLNELRQQDTNMLMVNACKDHKLVYLMRAVAAGADVHLATCSLSSEEEGEVRCDTVGGHLTPLELCVKATKSDTSNEAFYHGIRFLVAACGADVNGGAYSRAHPASSPLSIAILRRDSPAVDLLISLGATRHPICLLQTAVAARCRIMRSILGPGPQPPPDVNTVFTLRDRTTGEERKVTTLDAVLRENPCVYTVGLLKSVFGAMRARDL